MTLPDPISTPEIVIELPAKVDTRSTNTLRHLVALNLKRVRKYLKMNQRDIADASGVSMQTISNIEQERFSASIDTLEQIAKGLGIAPNRLLRELARLKERERSGPLFPWSPGKRKR